MVRSHYFIEKHIIIVYTNLIKGVAAWMITM